MAYSRKVEALAEAITKYSGYQDPASPLHAIRNPGDIRDEIGPRVYRSFLDGYQSLLHDLSVKLSGRSRSGLTSSSTLLDLATARKETMPAVISRHWALFIKAALHEEVTNKTPLSFFE